MQFTDIYQIIFYFGFLIPNKKNKHTSPGASPKCPDFDIKYKLSCHAQQELSIDNEHTTFKHILYPQAYIERKCIR